MSMPPLPNNSDEKDEICPKCQSQLDWDRNLDWENEIWICDNCNTEFLVHIEYVRDWKDIEEVVEK